MLLRLPNPAARLAVLVFAFALAVTLTFLSVRNARAVNNAGLGTRAGYEAAVRLEPANAENWYLFGRYWQYTLDEPDSRRAISNFRRALAINPAYTDAWLDLASVYETEGNAPAALDAFLQPAKPTPHRPRCLGASGISSYVRARPSRHLLKFAAPYTRTRSAAQRLSPAVGALIPMSSPFSTT